MVKALQVKNFPNYFVTDAGDIYTRNYNKTGRFRKLKPWSVRGGYLRVELCKNGKVFNKSIHRLVAESFLPNPEHKSQVNHLNGVTFDNRVTNLEWVTGSENNLHAYRELNRKAPRSGLGKFGKRNKSSKAVLQIKDGLVLACFNGMLEANRATGVNFRNISNCCLGRRKTAGGYQWKYQEQGGM